MVALRSGHIFHFGSTVFPRKELFFMLLSKQYAVMYSDFTARAAPGKNFTSHRGKFYFFKEKQNVSI